MEQNVPSTLVGSNVLDSGRGKKLSIALGLILLISLPLLLIAVKQRQDNRSSAAAPDKLEAEGGTLSSGVQSLADSLASGGNYIVFGGFSITAGPSVQNVTGTTAEITWTLSEPGTGQVEYGQSPTYGQVSALESSFTYATHVQTLSNLTTGATYHYRVKSTNQSGQQVVSGGKTFVAGTPVTSGPTQPPVTSGPTPPTGLKYPPDRQLSYVATPNSSPPGYLSTISESPWGTKVMRISNVNGVRNRYARTQPWNSNGTRLLLARPYPGQLLDGNTYQVLDSSFNYPHLPIWSNTEPDIMYGTQGNKLVRWRASTDSLDKVVHTFSDYSSVDIGGGEGQPDDSDRYWPILAGDTVIIYDRTNDSIVATKTFASGSMNWASLSRKGDYVTVGLSPSGTGTSQGLWLFNRSLGTAIRQLDTAGGWHGDHALDANGNDIFVYATGGVKSFNLAANTTTVLMPTDSNPAGYIHISGRAYNRNGWVYISNYDSTKTANKKGSDQVFAVKTDGSKTVQVFSFSHTGAELYEASPFATPNRDGTKVIFGTRWGGSNIYAYVAWME